MRALLVYTSEKLTVWQDISEWESTVSDASTYSVISPAIINSNGQNGIDVVTGRRGQEA